MIMIGKGVQETHTCKGDTPLISTSKADASCLLNNVRTSSTEPYRINLQIGFSKGITLGILIVYDAPDPVRSLQVLVNERSRGRIHVGK